MKWIVASCGSRESFRVLESNSNYISETEISLEFVILLETQGEVTFGRKRFVLSPTLSL